MRQMARILFTVILVISLQISSYAAIKGGIDYKIPIDYNNLNEAELLNKADIYYTKAFNLNPAKPNSDMTDALNLYAILCAKCPENVNYAVKLGSLYEYIGKDRQAKGQFYRAMGVEPNNPLPYFYLGELYYNRELYRKGLKFYLQAYERGDISNYQLLYKIGDIYQKFGDNQNAIKYLQSAQNINPNKDLEDKINKIQN